MKMQQTPQTTLRKSNEKCRTETEMEMETELKVRESKEPNRIDLCWRVCI